MPVPPEYERASDEFYSFLVDVRDTSSLTTTHQTYTMVQGVLQAFRQRLSVDDAILFCSVLPVGLRALFVADWDLSTRIKPFGDIEEMTEDVRCLRRDHNFSTPSAISDVAKIMWMHLDSNEFEKVLDKLPDGAKEYWKPNSPGARTRRTPVPCHS